MATSICNDTSECVELFEPHGLFLKPLARLNVSVQLPSIKNPGKSISNWEVMEKIKHFVRPDQFTQLKVVKSTLEFIRFEGEADNKALIKLMITRLDSKTIKLSGFPDTLKVRAAEAKSTFPSRHDWDSFFRDAKNMNEMKAGERPDTVHMKDLPIRWFVNRNDDVKDKPSEYLIQKIFEQFGEIRCMDIPCLDPYRQEMVLSKIKGSAGTATAPVQRVQQFSTFGPDLTFEVYLQYKEYMGFVKCMNALRDKKLMFKDDEGKAFVAPIKVDFDKLKHLTDKNIRKRRLEREMLAQLERQREDKREDERRRQEQEKEEKQRKLMEKQKKKEERRKMREIKRHEKNLERKRQEEQRRMQLRIAREERKMIITQRKLESIRIMKEILKRLKAIKEKEELVKKEHELEEERRRQVEKEKKIKMLQEKRKILAQKRKKEKLEQQEKELRNRILKNYRTLEERKAEIQREELRKKLSGSKRLKSAIIMHK
ncbi:unnamed protein product [Owenia fusiformis]|uniref:Uncharacterized protein n=1 Tax=Owenia fusiformis TaxID=6347 RepID=A0A8J1THA4_OWEFU|nr:unnamed protein product [Owenia fusiformis]